MTKPHATQPAGYAHLEERFAIDPVPHFRSSHTADHGATRIEVHEDHETHIYAKSYRPDPSLGAQLEFALKNDGINLGILKQVFERCDIEELTSWIQSKRNGRYTRRAWFLYEWLTGQQLAIPDVPGGSYIDLLDTSKYYTGKPRNSSRHKVRDNLLGTPAFCPIVRRPRHPTGASVEELRQRIDAIIARFDPALWHRASQYLYLKETRSSFEIEREQPNQQRALRFVELLGQAGAIEDLSEQTLSQLQNSIVEPRYAESGFRSEQNYVGQTVGYREHIHFVCPKPKDVPGLMQGLAACSERMAEAGVDAVVWAAVLSFGFVYIHPFLDGNGRLHRFLLHHVLTRTGLTPAGSILPLSATMLAHMNEYDRCLETFSKPLNRRINFKLDHLGQMTVEGQTVDDYRYFDSTTTVDYLRSVLEQTIDGSFAGELEYLERFDTAWRALRDIVDMPDQKLNLFIRICIDNHGRLSDRKRKSHFGELTGDEIIAMESVMADTLPEAPRQG